MRAYILEVASRLFYQHGLRAVGVDRVIAEAGIAKATLYRHFPNKEMLIVAYLDTRSAAALASITAALKKGTDARSRVITLFDRLSQITSSGFRGCAFVRALSEHLESEEIRHTVVRHKDAVRTVIAQAIADTSVDQTQIEHLSQLIAVLYEGALSSALVYGSSNAVGAAKQAALTLLDSSDLATAC